MQFTFQQAGTGGKRKSKLPTAEEYARYLAAGDTDVRKPPSAKGYADYLQTREGQAGRDRDAYDSRVRQSYKERRLAAEEAEKAANIVQAGDKTFTISKNFLPGGQLGELRQEDISAREKEKARREEQLDALSKKRGEGVSFLDKGEMEEIGETADAYFRKAPLNTGKRIWYGAGNIGKTMTGAAPLIAETADAAREEAAASRRKRENDPDYARYYGQLSETLARLEALRDEVRQSDKPAGETEEEIARLEGDVNRLEGILREKGEAYAPVLPDTWGMERLREARGDAEKALEGLSPGGQFLGSAALSVGQNLALMPTAVINPALPLAGMGVLSAADKMFGLNERGVRPGEALFRGAVAGGIEALTEKIPLDSVIDMVKAGGRGFVKNMLRQAGTEATEEGISYALNYIADKAAKDPEAGFSVAELLESAAAGGLSGLFFGLGGTALGRVTGSAQGRAGTVATAGETQTAAGAYPGMAGANAGQSALSGQNNAAPTEGTAKGFSSEFPEVVTPMFWNKEYKNNPDRQAAKKGDEVAAKRLVDSIVTQEFADQVGRRFSGAEIVPVVDIETKDGNVLAKEFAKTLSERSGLTLNGSIGKMNRTTHAKAKNAFQRLLQRAKFSGDITPGQTYYLIADDFVSLGSTASDLKRYIESKGGRVAGVTALSASGEASLRLAPSEEKIARLEGFGREEVESVLQKYGIVDTLEELTDAEAGVLLRVADFDTVRKGLVPFHEELDARLHREGAGGDGGQGTVPLRMADAGGSGHAAGVADTSGENARGRDILASETDQEVYGNGEAGVGPASFMPGRTEAELAERLPAYEKLLSGRALSESEAARIQGDEGAVAALRAKGYVIEGSPAEQRQIIKAVARGEIAPQRGGDAPMSAWRYEDMGRPAGEENAAERAERAKAALMEEEAAGPDAPDFESVQPPVYYGGTWESVKRTTESGKRLGVEAGRVRRAAELSHALRVPVEFYRGGGEHGYYEGGAIHLNAGSDHPAADVFFHELTHFVEQGGMAYGAFMDAVMDSQVFADYLESKGLTLGEYKAAVAEMQPDLDPNGVDRETAALFVERFLFRDQASVDALARSDKGLFSRVRNYVSYLVQKLKGSSFEKEIRKLERLYGKAYRAAQKAGTHTDTGRKYSINQNFEAAYDNWVGKYNRTGRMTLKVGRTSEALKSIGVKDQDIFWDTSKINDTLKKHAYMNDGIMKQVPGILENPIIVMQSKGFPSRITMFGEVYDGDGLPILAVLELTPNNKSHTVTLDEMRLASTYSKGDDAPSSYGSAERKARGNQSTQNLINSSKILYVDANKNRTSSWLSRNRLQLPLEITKFGPIDRVSYADTAVNSQDMQKGKKDAQKSVLSPDEVAEAARGLKGLTPKGPEKGADKASAFRESLKRTKILDPDFIAKAEADPRATRYRSVSNEETMDEAARRLAEGGVKAIEGFINKAPKNYSAADVSMGFILLHRFQAEGNYDAALRVVQNLREAGTAAGQTVQAFSILGRLTPEGMTAYAQSELDALYKRLKKKQTEGWLRANKEKFQLTPADMDFIRRRVTEAAKLPEGRDKNILLAEINSRIQSKIPPDAVQGLKSWARVSMLLNPRTNVRNVLGNAVIMPMHTVSDFIGAGLDKAISAKTGVRTTGMYDPRSVKGMAKGFYESYDDFRRKINTRDLSGDRFEIGEGPAFRTDRPLGRALNALDRTTSFLLDLGDRPFYEMWFVNSLNNQMKLNKASEATAEMIDIARQEALERTWQDDNRFTESLTKIRDGLNILSYDKGRGRFGLGNLVFAFTKTPANLTKAMWEFSPMGLTYALSNEAQRFYSAVKYGTATPQMQKSFVSHMGKAAAGTIGMAVFALMAGAGIITGAGDEDRDAAAFQKDVMGVRPYSIRIGNTTYTYDWAQPVAGLMAAAADMMTNLKQGKDAFDGFQPRSVLNLILGALEAGGGVLFKQSVYKGLSELFQSDNIMGGLIGAALGLPVMMTSSFLQQIAQMGDPVARTSYEAGDPWGTMINQVKAKIPGLRQTLAPQVDVLGREVAAKTDIFNVMLNPANQSSAQTTAAANEIWDLYQKTGDKGVFPAKAPYSVSKGGQTYRMTSRERADYQKAMGGMASEAISELVANPYYSLLPDEAKAKLLKKIYAYGRDKASEALGFARSDDYKKAYMAEEMGISPGTYYLYNVTANRDGEGIVTQEEAEETLDAMDLTMEQKAYLWALQDAGWSSKSNPYKRRYKIEGFTKR